MLFLSFMMTYGTTRVPEYTYPSCGWTLQTAVEPPFFSCFDDEELFFIQYRKPREQKPLSDKSDNDTLALLDGNDGDGDAGHDSDMDDDMIQREIAFQEAVFRSDS